MLADYIVLFGGRDGFACDARAFGGCFSGLLLVGRAGSQAWFCLVSPAILAVFPRRIVASVAFLAFAQATGLWRLWRRGWWSVDVAEPFDVGGQFALPASLRISLTLVGRDAGAACRFIGFFGFGGCVVVVAVWVHVADRVAATVSGQGYAFALRARCAGGQFGYQFAYLVFGEVGVCHQGGLAGGLAQGGEVFQLARRGLVGRRRCEFVDERGRLFSGDRGLGRFAL